MEPKQLRRPGYAPLILYTKGMATAHHNYGNAYYYLIRQLFLLGGGGGGGGGSRRLGEQVRGEKSQVSHSVISGSVLES